MSGSHFKSIKDTAWVYYKAWMNEKTYSPAFKKNVRISRKGWDHLIAGSNSKRRNIKDKINRLNLLKAAKFVTKTTSSFETSERKGIKYYTLKSVNKINGRKYIIKVIFKKDQHGDFYFFSVMKR